MWKKLKFIVQISDCFSSVLMLLGQTIILTVLSRSHWYAGLDQKARHYHFVWHGKKISLWMRIGDLPVFYDIFLHEIYRPDFSLEKPACMVDLGAHIGLATVYFSLTYAPDHIIALEPDPQNCLLFQKNTTLLPCHLIHGAINEIDQPVYFQNDILNYKGKTSVQKQTLLKVPGISIRSILQSSGFSAIDLLKADIEGAEQILYKHNCDWLPFTNYIIMEVHQDRLASDIKTLLEQQHFKTNMVPCHSDYLIQASRVVHR